MTITGVCLPSYPHFLPISTVTRTIFYKCKSDYFYILAKIFQWFSLIFRFYNLQVLHSMVFLPLHIHSYYILCLLCCSYAGLLSVSWMQVHISSGLLNSCYLCLEFFFPKWLHDFSLLPCVCLFIICSPH